MSSSPNESISDFDDAASTKKRGRDQSVEPQDQPTQITQKEVEDNQPTSSAPKKSKRIDEEDLDSTTTTSVRTIRRNLKDMSTADRSNPTSDNEPEDATMHQDEDEQDNAMHQDQKEDNSHLSNNSIPAETEIKENKQSMKEQPVSTEHQQEQLVSGGKDKEEEEDKSSKNKHAFAAFGGNSHDDDDWGEFEEDDKEEQAKKEQEATDKPKYTFGATSGFGTKGWSSQQTATPPVTQTTQKPTFGGFSGSGFGAFASSEKPSSSFSSLATSSTINNTSNTNNHNNNNNNPTFGSFSSFARAAAASKTTTTTTTTTTTNDSNTTLAFPQTKESNELSNTNNNTEANNNNNDTSHSSTTSQRNATLSPELPSAVIDMNTINTNNNNTIKSKPLQQPPTEVITGEEEEDTLYQTRAKLYEMEQNNWKERGLGTLRIKQHKENTQQRRVIMRADSVYRLILNVRLVSYLKFDINQEKFVQFLLIEKEENSEGKIENRFRKFALKVSNASAAEELLHELVSALPNETDEEH